MEKVSYPTVAVNGQPVPVISNQVKDKLDELVDAVNDLNDGTIASTTITATTVNATTFDTNVAAAGVTLVGKTLAADGTDSNIPITITPKGTAGIETSNGSAAKPAYSFTNDPDTGIIDSAANALGFVTGGTEQWTLNSSGALNPTSDNAKDIGNLSVNPRDIHISRSLIKKGISSTEGYGQLAIKSIAASKTLTNAQTNTLAIQIPSGVKLIGVQMRNDTIVAGVDDATGLTPITTYSAIYATGATQSINATIAVAKNTKVNKFFDANAATDILSGATDITLDAGSGNKFTAGGIISAIAYYYEFTSIIDAA